MPAYATRLLRRRDLSDATAAFMIERPAGFTFEAGQSINLTLPEPAETDAKGNTRTFSLASAPCEDHLEIATRLRTSAFKRALAALAPGAELRLRGPGGKFVLPGDERPVALIAGGIGITPFVSMLRSEAAGGSMRGITLLYANRREDDAPYLDELRSLERRLPRLAVVPAFTAAEREARCGERGPIDAAMVRRHARRLVAPLFYLAGPPAMVADLRATLGEAGIAAADIRVDEFYGY